jgi:ubiquinone/menaquinone biosynthesis C-methylase UbiE
MVARSTRPKVLRGADDIMQSSHSRPYAIHCNTECDRLERQAALAGLREHLSFVPVPPRAHILDAGCGSGSMSRSLAATHPEAKVVGIDVRTDYVAYARERAAQEGLTNIEFREGDIFHLPFADAEFDVVWSKYVLQWVREPQLAIGEFRRVTRKGGHVVCANFDGFAVTHWPEDPALQPLLLKVFARLVDPFVGRKSAPMFMRAGLSDIRVDFEPDRLFTVIGRIDSERRRNWVEQLTAARPYVAQFLGGEPQADEFVTAFLAYQERPDTCSYTALYFVRGTVR